MQEHFYVTPRLILIEVDLDMLGNSQLILYRVLVIVPLLLVWDCVFRIFTPTFNFLKEGGGTCPTCETYKTQLTYGSAGIGWELQPLD